MRHSLETEGTDLRSFRRKLRGKPAIGRLQKPPAPTPPWAAPVNWLDWSWQKAEAALWWAILPSAQRHLLDQADMLESILKTNLDLRVLWARRLFDSDMSRMDLLEVRVCEASDMWRSARWVLEAKLDELPRPIASDDNDDFHASTRGGGVGTIIRAELASGLSALQGTQASFAHMCLFAKADRKAAIEVISKLASDKKWYRSALESLENVRARIKADPLTDPAKIVGLEREMDEIALSMLNGIKYWEEQQQDG